MNVEELIRNSFKEFLNLDSATKIKADNGTNLIFPTTSGSEEPRISEQEMRFLFVKQLDKRKDYAYSVETPTCQKYRFSDDDPPKIDDKKGQSGNTDVCLYEKKDNKYQKIHLIEFKALNPKQRSYEKDFLKLLRDKNGLTNYFVQVIKNSKKRTLDSIERKYDESLANALKEQSTNWSQLKIFLCDKGKEQITVYEVSDSGVKQIEQITVR
jgi:hypothetical protein